MVRPDASLHVARARGKVATALRQRGAWGYGDDRVLVTLQHQLSSACPRVPELNTSILRTRKNPVGIWRQGNGQNEVAVALEGLDTLTTLRSGGAATVTRGAEFPHLDGPVKTTTDKILAVGREGDRVNAILVAVRALKSLNEESSMNIPDADALVQGSGCYILGVRRNGNGGHTIFNREGESVSA